MNEVFCTQCDWPLAVIFNYAQFYTYATTSPTAVTLASTNNVLPDDGVTTPKHVRAILMLILM
jgi:hypothetical protein